jgi:hypothetical protein
MDDGGEARQRRGSGNGARGIRGETDSDEMAWLGHETANIARRDERLELACLRELREHGVENVVCATQAWWVLLIRDRLRERPERGNVSAGTPFGERQLEIRQRENAVLCQRVDALGVGRSELVKAS